jgi:predicted nuclease of predicted toxin-antitoxin system
VKLLLDQNLSRFLVDSLKASWPDTSHIALHGMECSSDRQLWDFAKTQGYCIISKDSDFLHLALLHGFPPKVIIVKAGNVSTASIAHSLLTHRMLINTFLDDAGESALIIP